MSWLTMDFIREQRRNLPIDMTPEKCKNATFIITGANIGLGLEVSRHLVRLGSKKVILAVRNTKAGEAAVRDIETSTRRKGIAEMWELDLGSYDSIKAFAKRANESLDRLDGLVENASVALDKWSVAEGHETSVTVNVYGTFLLGVLLLPKLRETGRRFGVTPHLVVVSSSIAFMHEADVEGLQKGGLAGLDSTTSSIAARYGVSKMIQIFGVRELAKQHPVLQSGVVLNVVNPGLVKTGLTRHLAFGLWFFIGFFRLLFARTPEMGSRTELHALAAGKETHGKFLDNCQIKDDTVPVWMTNDAGSQLQTKLWIEIVRELERIAPGCIERTM